MNNSKIVGTRGLVFLGAGASQALGKMLMGEFVESLTRESPPDKELFDKIVNRSKDLEFLIQQLDELSSKRWLAPPSLALGRIQVPGESESAGRWDEFKRIQSSARPA